MIYYHYDLLYLPYIFITYIIPKRELSLLTSNSNVLFDFKKLYDLISHHKLKYKATKAYIIKISARDT